MTCHACGGHGDAAVDALNAIAALCGCPEWEYAGQVVRDVEAMRKRQAELELELFDRVLPVSLTNIPPVLDRAIRSAAGCDRPQPDAEIVALARAVWSCASMDSRPKTPAHAVWQNWIRVLETERVTGMTTKQLLARQLLGGSVAGCCATWLMTPDASLENIILEQLQCLGRLT